MKTLKTLYFLLLPLSYIVYIIYIRLFLERPPRPLFVELSQTQMAFTLLVIFGLVLRIYLLLKREGILKEKENKNKVINIIITLLTRLDAHLTRVKIYCYRILLPKTVSFALLVLKGLNILYKTLSTEKRGTIFIFFVEVLPKIIVLLSFLIDVFLFKEFYYFYKTVGLLLLPLSLSLLEFLLLEYYSDNLKPMIALISSEPHTRPGLEDYDDFCFINPDRIPDFIHGIDDFIENHFLPIYKILFFVVDIRTLKDTYYSYKVQLIVSCLYLMGWITILFFGIQL